MRDPQLDEAVVGGLIPLSGERKVGHMKITLGSEISLSRIAIILHVLGDLNN